MKKNNTLNLNPTKQILNIADLLLEGVQIIDFKWTIIYANNALCLQTNTSKETLIGKSIKELFPNIEKTLLFKTLEECMLNRKMHHFENEFIFNNTSKKWFEIKIKPVEEGICVVSLDISEYKATQQKILKISRLYAFISQVNQNIVRINDEEVLFKNSCQIAIKFGKFKIAWIGLFDKEKKKISLVKQSGISTIDVVKLQHIDTDYAQKSVLHTGECYICNDIANDIGLENWKSFSDHNGIFSCIILPIKKSDEIIGTFNLYSSDLGFFDKDEIKLLVEVTADISFAIDQFEKAKQHKRNEEIILHNEKRFRSLIENSTDVIALTNNEGKFIYGSPNFTKVLGYSEEEFLHRSGFTMIHPDNLIDFSARLNDILLVPGNSFHTQQRLKHKNGKWIWCEGKVTNMMHLKSVHAIVINFSDISEKKKTEEKLLKSETFSRNIINSLNAHIAVIDSKGTIVAVNDAWNRFAIENNESTLVHTGLGSNYFKVCQKSSLSGDVTASEVLIGLENVMNKLTRNFYFEYPCHSSTKERWFAMLAMPFDGEEELVVVAHQNISERKLAEDILLEKNEELQKINFELDRFVYSVSHDLRSPLTSVLGLLSFIQEDTNEPETLAHTLMIQESINRLDAFIKNILSYSRNNRMELQIEQISLQETTEKIVKTLLHIKEAETISFEVKIEEKCQFFSDKQSYATIIENLISNAIKFQDKKKPLQYIKIIGTSKDDYLNLEISDNGIGIAAENYTKIFDMFLRLSGEIDGSGIGLYIVKEIITKVKGTINVESKLGLGTTFKIKFKNLKPC